MTFSTIGKLLGSATVASLLMVGAASAQTATDTTGTYTGTSVTGSTTDSGTAGVPNTGTGGDMAMNLALLGGSVIATVAGVAYVARRKNV